MFLRQAHFEDWDILFKWRNDPETRKSSHSTNTISIDSHKSWLQSVLDNESKKIYIAIENDIPVGTVRADYYSEYCKLSWTIAPEFRGKGIGKAMVKILADSISMPLKAEVKKDNIASVKIAEYIGLILEKEENGILFFYSENKNLKHSL
jgi:RimJ/RimL family protein N-acetyltransferase